MGESSRERGSGALRHKALDADPLLYGCHPDMLYDTDPQEFADATTTYLRLVDAVDVSKKPKLHM
eukprot:5538559-Alexandrium_andersonii.AAC.1